MAESTEETIKRLEAEVERLEKSERHAWKTFHLGGGQCSQAQREEVERLVNQFGCTTLDVSSIKSNLQWKWRHTETLPKEFSYEECEAALLDALVIQGSCSVWRGDGLSCAAQIVKSAWDRSSELEKENAILALRVLRLEFELEKLNGKRPL